MDTSPSYDLMYAASVEACQQLVTLGVHPLFAWKSVFGLPRNPRRVHAILVREVLQSSNAQVVQWVDDLRHLNLLITILRSLPGQVLLLEAARLAGQRDALFQWLHAAQRCVYAHMPCFWPWLIQKTWPRQRGGQPPLHPTATLCMALIVAHLKDLGRKITAADYAALATIVCRLFPGAVRSDVPEQERGKTVKVRSHRALAELNARDIAGRRALLASVDQLWAIRHP